MTRLYKRSKIVRDLPAETQGAFCPSFATKVIGLPMMFIRVETLIASRRGVQKKLRREINLLSASAPEDTEFRAKKKANIERLRAIREELKELAKK